MRLELLQIQRNSNIWCTYNPVGEKSFGLKPLRPHNYGTEVSNQFRVLQIYRWKNFHSIFEKALSFSYVAKMLPLKL